MNEISFNQQQQYNQSSTSTSSNNFDKIHDQCNLPIILISLAFKFLPILIYVLLKLNSDQYLSTFIIISILLSADFWVTKNLGGRHLVALRWYTKLDDSNQQTWCFQSDERRVPALLNKAAFWGGQIIPIMFWLSITVINMVTLKAFWVFLALFCCVLLGTNFVFFLQCKGDHQKKVNKLTKRLGIQFFELNQQK